MSRSASAQLELGTTSYVQAETARILLTGTDASAVFDGVLAIGGLDFEGRSLTIGETAQIVADDDIGILLFDDFVVRGQLAARGDIGLGVRNAEIDGGAIESGGALNIMANGALIIRRVGSGIRSGSVTGQDVTINAVRVEINEGASIQARATGQITTSAVIGIAGNVLSNGMLVLDAGTDIMIADTAQVESSGNLRIDAAGHAMLDGTIGGQNSVRIAAGSIAAGVDGQILSGANGRIDLIAAEAVSSRALLSAGDVAIQGQSITLLSESDTRGGTIMLTAAGDLTLAGSVSAQTDLTLNATQIRIDEAANVTSDDRLHIRGADGAAPATTLTVAGGLGAASISADATSISVTQTGDLIATGDLTLNTQSLVNSGEICAGVSAEIDAYILSVLSGAELTSVGTLRLGSFTQTIQGTVAANGAVTINTQDLYVDAGGRLESAEASLTVTAGGLTRDFRSGPRRQCAQSYQCAAGRSSAGLSLFEWHGHLEHVRRSSDRGPGRRHRDFWNGRRIACGDDRRTCCRRVDHSRLNECLPARRCAAGGHRL